jgi:hypothetical protein
MTLSENPPFGDSIPLSRSSHSMAPKKAKQKFVQISYLEGIYFSSANLVALDPTIE